MVGSPICIRNDERGEGDTVSDLGVERHWPSINPRGRTFSLVLCHEIPTFGYRHSLNDPSSKLFFFDFPI